MQWIDPNIAYSDIGIRPGALWSVLYMSGYLTTDGVGQPEDASVLRRLRVPNVEVRGVFGRKVLSQIEEKAYGAGSAQHIRRGVALCGKRAAVARDERQKP